MAHRTRDDLGNVRRGINLVYFGIVLIGLAILLSLLTPILAAFLPAAVLLLLSFPLMMLGATALNFVGKLLCLSTPEEVGARGVIAASVALDALVGLDNLGDVVTELPPILGLAANLAAIASLVLFLVYLRRLSIHLGDAGSAGRASGVLKVGVMLLVTFAAFILGGLLLPPIAVVAGLVALVLAIIVLIRYVRLIAGLRGSLST